MKKHGLTPRQYAVAQCISRAYLDKQTAQLLGIRYKTVKVFVGEICDVWQIDRTMNLRVQIARRMWELEPARDET